MSPADRQPNQAGGRIFDAAPAQRVADGAGPRGQLDQLPFLQIGVGVDHGLALHGERAAIVLADLDAGHYFEPVAV